MKKKLRSMLNDSEQELARTAGSKKLAKLDEDELIDLHSRVRRARNKYSKLYRKRAAKQVSSKKRRDGAGSAHSKTRAKAEIFEDVLATVSTRLATVARENADALKAERLAAAKGDRSGAARPVPGKSVIEGAIRTVKRGGDDALRSPIKKKKSAGDRAAKKRHEAKRS